MSATAATIMLVEDDPSLGQLLAEELEMDGYAVERAATVQEARGLLQQQRPALIVSDLRALTEVLSRESQSMCGGRCERSHAEKDPTTHQ